jgi:serine/threonine-protein kinase
LVAIKILRPEIARALGPERFLREIEIAARLQHPLILPVFDSGAAMPEAGDLPCLWYTMPLIEGESLRDRLAREKQLPIEEAVRIAREVAEALGCAHARGIVHRDVKPENILFSGGHALVADFGIARALSVAGGDRLTETGLSLGTPAYMSPEQAADSHQLDARSDQYSLGCVVYEMLAGVPPFLGPSARAVQARHALDPVPALRTLRPGVSAPLEQSITRALAKVPADRFSTVAEFADALVGDGAHRPTTVPKSGTPAWAMGAGLILGLLVLLVLVLNRTGPLPRPPDGATPGATPVPVRSLAILPLRSPPGDSALGDGMTEALITDLGRVGSLRVISRAAVQRHTTTGLAARDLARTLGVDAVLEGELQRDADTIEADLRLIAPTGGRLWAGRFREPEDSRFALEVGISRSLISSVGLPLTSARERTLQGPPTDNPLAYDEFLKGKIHLRTETKEENAVAIRHFERAVALDPKFAAAYAGLASAYGVRMFWFAPRDTAVLENGLVAAEKALRLDPELAEGHYARAFLLWTPAAHFAHEQAIQELRRAIALNPNMAEAHDWLGVVYWHLGLFAKALDEFRQVEALDPGNRLAQHRFGMVLVYQGKYEEGLRILRQIPREFNPSLVTYNFAWTLVLTGHAEEASKIIEEYLRTSPADPGGVVTSVRAILHAQTGDVKAAERDIHRVIQLGPGFGHFHHAAYNIASAYALLGKSGPAVEWLRRVVDDGLPCYPLFITDRNLDRLRQDPGFLALLAELKPEWERWEKTL